LTVTKCRHGLGYTKILGAKNGIEVELLFFVPPGENLEIWKTTVRNSGKTPKDFKLFSFVEFCLFEALNDMTNYQRTYSMGEVEIEGSAIYHQDRYRERRNHYSVIRSAPERGCYDTSRDAFVGVHMACMIRPFLWRKAATAGHSVGIPLARTRSIDMKPGEEVSFAFLLAYVDQGNLPKFRCARL